MDPTSETKAKFAKETVDQISKLEFTSEKTKYSNDALTMTTEMMRIYVLEQLTGQLLRLSLRAAKLWSLYDWKKLFCLDS